MYLGLVDDKLRRPTNKGQRGICPACNSKIVAKCGEINMWHWAHESLLECSGESETETYWHRYYKKLVPIEWVEKTVKANGQTRRADILKPTNPPIAYEFQHSPITLEEIRARENFYLNEAKVGLVWIFDLQEKSMWQSGDKQDEHRFHLYPKIKGQIDLDSDVGFFWENGQKTIMSTTTKVYFDLGLYDNRSLMLSLQTFGNTEKFSGRGRIYNEKMFLGYELLFSSSVGRNILGGPHYKIIK